MAEHEFPSNSHKARVGEKLGASSEPDEKKIKKVATAVTPQKKSLGRRLLDSFTGEDMRSVAAYVIFEVLVPAAKDTLVQMVQQGIERTLYGEQAPRSSAVRSRNYTNYNRVSSPARSVTRYPDQPRSVVPTSRSGHKFDDIVLETRQEAIDVLEQMHAIVDQYDFISLFDLYDMVGITGSHVDNKWGWGDLRGSDVRRVREGYILVLPKIEPAN